MLLSGASDIAYAFTVRPWFRQDFSH
ncbi:protein of unknown function [Bradyrhizobium sp. ORS 285]|nr:protein of unknown function [Bradyrhizobium sp. ORS 285]